MILAGNVPSPYSIFFLAFIQAKLSLSWYQHYHSDKFDRRGIALLRICISRAALGKVSQHFVLFRFFFFLVVACNIASH